MGFGLANIDIGGIASGIGTAVEKIGDAIRGHKVIDEVELQKILASLTQAQTEINKAEAQSSNMFVAGWRPFIGWICGCGLIWGVFIHPIWVWLSRLFSIVEPPEVQTAALITILLGMLGLGGLRTYEKKEDIQGKH